MGNFYWQRIQKLNYALFNSSANSYLLLDKEYCIVAFNKAVKDFIQFAYGITITTRMKITQFVQEEFICNCSKALCGEIVRQERFLKFKNGVFL